MAFSLPHIVNNQWTDIDVVIPYWSIDFCLLIIYTFVQIMTNGTSRLGRTFDLLELSQCSYNEYTKLRDDHTTGLQYKYCNY